MTDVKRFSDIQAIPGHKNYYKSNRSGIIYYKDSTTPKFSTGESTIGRAKKVVETRKLGASGLSDSDVERKLLGITNPLIKSYWDELLEEKRPEISDSTMKKLGVSWNHGIKEFWGDKTISDITEDNVMKYKHWYLKNKGTRYAEKTIVHFKMVCKYILKKGVLLKLPDLTGLDDLDDLVSKLTRRKVAGRVYEEEAEVKVMLSTAQKISNKEYLNARAHLGILLGVRCGMRKMEAMCLKWENVDFKKRIIHVWSQKNHKWREVPMLDDILQAFTVQGVFTGVKSEWVFPMPSDRTKHITSQVFDKIWVAVKSKAKIKDWDTKNGARFHDLRHTFATRTAEDGWPPVAACKVLDMSLAIYQKVYAKPSTDKIAEMMKRTFDQKTPKQGGNYG